MSAGTRTGAGMRRGTVRLLPVPGMNYQAQVVPQTIRSSYQKKLYDCLREHLRQFREKKEKEFI